MRILLSVLILAAMTGLRSAATVRLGINRATVPDADDGLREVTASDAVRLPAFDVAARVPILLPESLPLLAIGPGVLSLIPRRGYDRRPITSAIRRA